MDDATIAKMYDHPSSQPAQAQPEETTMPTQPDIMNEAAQKLFKPEAKPQAENPGVPEHIRKLRADDSDRKMYDVQAMRRDAVPDDIFADVAGELPDGTPIGDEHKAAAVSEWREVVQDMGVTNAEAASFVKIAKEISKNPPDDAQAEKWRAESLKLMREKYGQRADGVLKMTKQLAQRDARFHALILRAPGLGNHPEIVTALAQAALRESTRGRLK